MKKLTLFIDKKIPKNRLLRMVGAIQYPSLLYSSYLCPMQRDTNGLSGVQKLMVAETPNHEYIRKGFDEAHRVEAHLVDRGNRLAVLVIDFYRATEQSPFRGLELGFDLEKQEFQPGFGCLPCA